MPVGGRRMQPAGGFRADLGFSVRSRWESNIARWLKREEAEGRINGWEYEPIEFAFPVERGQRFYRPDFAVYGHGESHPVYWEVKGWMDAPSRVKLARMAKYHPQVRIVVIDRAAYRRLEKAEGREIAEWEWDPGSEPKKPRALYKAAMAPIAESETDPCMWG